MFLWVFQFFIAASFPNAFGGQSSQQMQQQHQANSPAGKQTEGTPPLLTLHTHTSHPYVALQDPTVPTFLFTTCRRSSPTTICCRCLCHSARSFRPKSLSINKPISASVSVSTPPSPSCPPPLVTGLSCRFRELRQPDVGAASHPSHEWLPDRNETTQGATQATQERRQTILDLKTHRKCGKSLPSALVCTAVK